MRFLKRTVPFICVFLMFVVHISQAQQAQKNQDLSGLWKMHFNGVEAGCQDEAENGPKEGEFVFNVSQQGDTLSGTWTDGRATNMFTGRVSGSIVSAAVYGFYNENCRVLTDITVQIAGEGRLVGTYSGHELNCETCAWQGEVTIIIQDVPELPPPR